MMRENRLRPVRTAVAGAVVVVAALTGAAPAVALPTTTGTTTFLRADELPPHPSSDWYAGRITQGLPDPVPFCVAEVLTDGENARHRTFRTDLDAEAEQVVVDTGSAAEAGALLADLEEAAAGCAADWLEIHPEGSALQDDLGTVDAGDGAHVYGVHTALPESSENVHLVGVGRSGSVVTVVEWGQMGTLEDAPVTDFRTTTATAVNKL